MEDFQKQKHVRYWLRCLKTFLPNAYTSMDSNRMTLGFFILAALDLLDALDGSICSDERTAYIEWIYSHQLPTGGFRGSSASDLSHRASPENAVWDPANLPATYFGLAMLLVLKDDLSRVKRDECLTWLSALQRGDGSFGETLGRNGRIEGGTDTRFGYLAAATRWFLAGDISKSQNSRDIDVEALVQCLRGLQSFDGGIADLPYHEPHGGYTYCAVAALSILDRLDDGIADSDNLIHWLISRQTQAFHPPDDEDEDDEDDESDGEHGIGPTDASTSIGFNGRCNKIADTCYSWWIGATIQNLKCGEVVDKASAISYLTRHTQHTIGGFGKLPGEPPDIYHSFLGLASLSIFGHPEVKPIHTTANVSIDTVHFLEACVRSKYH